MPVLLLAAALAAGYYPPRIQAFADCMSDANVTLPIDPQRQAVYAEARKCLDATVAGALDEAGDASDLRAAIKDVYVKAGGKLDAQGAGPAKAAYDEARRRLYLETKLAGKSSEARD